MSTELASCIERLEREWLEIEKSRPALEWDGR